jgi:hypothetical protein
MPFQYRPRQNRYVGSITDLMGRGRDAEAQALITAANAQAQAAQASGQAWGGAIQGIGNTIGAIPGQLQAQQDRARVVEQRERADQARALRADILSPTPAHMTGPVMPEGTKLSPTTPGAAVEGPGSMAGDWGVATGRELPNRYRTTDANGSDIFDLEQIIATFAAAGLDPPDMSPYVAINQGIAARFDQSLQQARGIARSLLGGPSGAWGQGLSTALSLFEDNKLLPTRILSSMRTRLQQIGTLPAAEQEAELGQLLHQLTGDTAPETQFVRPDAVAVTPTVGGGFDATPVTAPGDRPIGKPTAQSLDGKPVNVWWDADGVPRDRHGTELVGDIQPASAAERLPALGSIGNLAVLALDARAEELGRPLTIAEKADLMQQVLDRNREGDPVLLPGEFSAEKINRIDQLMRSLRADLTYRGMEEINGAWQALQAAYATGGSGASDIAMINSFQRMIDPGVSVREGDVDLLQAASGLFAQIDPRFLKGQATRGDRIPDTQRKRMMALGRAIFAARLKDYQSKTENRFKRLATGAAVPFDLISGGFEPIPSATDSLPNTADFRWEDLTALPLEAPPPEG